MSQFEGLSILGNEIELREDGGGIDAVTGATITSRAMVDALIKPAPWSMRCSSARRDPTMTQTPSLREALWHNNPALIQLLGLCPLLAVSQYAVTAITLGLISLAVMTLSNLIISLLRPHVRLIRLPLQIMVIASLVTAADLLLQAFYFELHQRIGLFVALIVTNCAILGRMVFARRSSAPKALIDGWFMGLGFFWVIALMGMAREILGQGTIFAEAGRLTGLDIPNSGIQITSFSIQLVSFAPGAFFIFALIIAAKNYLDLRHEQRQENSVSQPTKG